MISVRAMTVKFCSNTSTSTVSYLLMAEIKMALPMAIEIMDSLLILDSAISNMREIARITNACTSFFCGHF